MQPSVIVALWAVSILFELTPGADWALAIAAGLRTRPRASRVVGRISGAAMILIALLLLSGTGTL